MPCRTKHLKAMSKWFGEGLARTGLFILKAHSPPIHAAWGGFEDRQDRRRLAIVAWDFVRPRSATWQVECHLPSLIGTRQAYLNTYRYHVAYLGQAFRNRRFCSRYDVRYLRNRC